MEYDVFEIANIEEKEVNNNICGQWVTFNGVRFIDIQKKKKIDRINKKLKKWLGDIWQRKDTT